MVDFLARRATPGYALCPAGAAVWFWVAWDTVPPDDAIGASLPPRFAGYASTEEAAYAQARTAVALPPFRGALHGPGSQTRRATILWHVTTTAVADTSHYEP